MKLDGLHGVISRKMILFNKKNSLTVWFSYNPVQNYWVFLNVKNNCKQSGILCGINIFFLLCSFLAASHISSTFESVHTSGKTPLIISDFMFSWRRILTSRYYGMWRRVVWYIGPNVSRSMLLHLREKKKTPSSPETLSPIYQTTHLIKPWFWQIYLLIIVDGEFITSYNCLRKIFFFLRRRVWIGLVLAQVLFSASRPVLGPTQPPIQWVPRVLSPGIKRQGREADYSN
jgi:hypothetical protein